MIPVLAALLTCAVPQSGSLADIGVQPRFGARVPADLRFGDADGAPAALADLPPTDRPILLVLAYYHCPLLCGLVLDEVARTLTALSAEGWRAGSEFRAVTISFDPEEGPADARDRRAALKARTHAPQTFEHWPFWTADAGALARLLPALGVSVLRDPETHQIAHPAVVVVLTPDGRIARYLSGLELPPRDLRFALIEAGAGRVGTRLDRLLLRCFVYDPAARRYRPFVEGFMRAGGALLAGVLLAGWVVVIRRRPR